MTDPRQQAEDHRRRVIRAKLVRLENAPPPVRAAISTGHLAWAASRAAP